MNLRVQNASTATSDDCLDGRQALLSPVAALEIMLANVVQIEGCETVGAAAASGRVASAAVISETALPRFDNSAVDGFGVHADDLRRSAPLSLDLDACVRAGHAGPRRLSSGQTVRVLTGARVPDGVSAIVMEERAHRCGSRVLFENIPENGANIRRRGEDVSSGTIVLVRGSVVDPRHAAMLAACGIVTIGVRRRLRVGVLSTGDELVDATSELGPNEIVDSNRPLLMSLLSGPAVEATDLGIIADDPKRLSATLAEAASRFDLLVSTGGVSGSEADYLYPALIAAGGRCDAMKLALRPGKPIACGSLGAMQVMSLPGNPVAALVSFLLFVRPIVRKLIGASVAQTGSMSARTAETFFHKTGRTEFIPVSVVGRSDMGLPLLRKLGRGGSARLLPIVQADGFAQIDPGAGNVAEGEIVMFHPFASNSQL
ncbi:MAG: molybdopterin molybdotransferase MoeA [Alphaproteobacteria bacterium]|nr:molybdopterin molybdotransferase MoeA [Alphaproteobacteria bacterium]